jgi:hypothetical protein
MMEKKSIFTIHMDCHSCGYECECIQINPKILFEYTCIYLSPHISGYGLDENYIKAPFVFFHFEELESY